MRIESDDGYFELGRRDPDDPYTAWYIDAATCHFGRTFSVRHDRICLDMDASTLAGLAGFADLASNEFELTFGSGGWMRISRQPRGGLTWQWRVADPGRRAATEGEIEIDGEWANDACRRLIAILTGPG